jgi:hypothetical protein
VGLGCRGATSTGSSVISSVVIGAALLAAGCSSSSPHKGAAPTPSLSPSVASSSSVAPLPTPAINDSEGVDEMAGAATVSYSTGSAPFAVHTSADSPAQVGIDGHGHVTIDVTMSNAAGDLFSISGPAVVGGSSRDHVSILSPSTGLLVDTEQGNTCTVTFSRAGETGVAGTARCDAQTGAQSFTVTAAFHLG